MSHCDEPIVPRRTSSIPRLADLEGRCVGPRHNKRPRRTKKIPPELRGKILEVSDDTGHPILVFITQKGKITRDLPKTTPLPDDRRRDMDEDAAEKLLEPLIINKKDIKRQKEYEEESDGSWCEQDEEEGEEEEGSSEEDCEDFESEEEESEDFDFDSEEDEEDFENPDGDYKPPKKKAKLN